MDSPNFESAIKEIFRVLQKQGKIIFSTTHPCFLTKGFGWIQDEQASSVKLTVSNYFDDRPWVDNWKFSKAPVKEDIEPFTVPSFPRTLSSYLNALIEIGFVLKKIEEPRPSRGMCEKYPWLQRWRDHAAIFLYIRAVKP